MFWQKFDVDRGDGGSVGFRDRLARDGLRINPANYVTVFNLPSTCCMLLHNKDHPKFHGTFAIKNVEPCGSVESVYFLLVELVFC